jgi:type I restriction enzyme M protein
VTHNEIVQKLWNLCDVLRDDGINYGDYVTELVLLLFVKMEYEHTAFEYKLPKGDVPGFYPVSTDCWVKSLKA